MATCQTCGGSGVVSDAAITPEDQKRKILGDKLGQPLPSGPRGPEYTGPILNNPDWAPPKWKGPGDPNYSDPEPGWELEMKPGIPQQPFPGRPPTGQFPGDQSKPGVPIQDQTTYNEWNSKKNEASRQKALETFPDMDPNSWGFYKEKNSLGHPVAIPGWNEWYQNILSEYKKNNPPPPKPIQYPTDDWGFRPRPRTPIGDQYKQPIIGQPKPILPIGQPGRAWGESIPGQNYPAVEGPGNPSWERRNPQPEQPGNKYKQPIIGEPKPILPIRQPEIPKPIYGGPYIPPQPKPQLGEYKPTTQPTTPNITSTLESRKAENIRQGSTVPYTPATRRETVQRRVGRLSGRGTY